MLIFKVEIILEENQLLWKNNADECWKLDIIDDKLAKSDDEYHDMQVK